MLLASIGLYGLMAYSVAQRTREIGIRMALGAPRGKVLTMVLKQSLMLIVIGVIFGLAGTFLITPLVGNLLFGVKAKDPATFAIAALLLCVVGLAASFLPARGACGPFSSAEV